MLCLCVAGMICASAQKNVLSVPDVIKPLEKQAMLGVNIDNTTDITAVEFTMTMPDGFVLNTERAKLTERAGDHSFRIREIESQVYKVMIFSSNNTNLIGRTGKVLEIPVSSSIQFEYGSEHPITLTDVVLADKDGKDLTTGYEAGKIKIVKSPDLEISAVTVSPSSLKPGDEMSVSWKVENVGGLPTGGGWSEQVFLVDNSGKEKNIGRLYNEDILQAGGNMSRNTTFTLPSILGMDGDLSILVRLTPNKDCGEPDGLRQNNENKAENTVNVTKILTLTPNEINTEEKEAKTLRLQLTRSGNVANAETFEFEDCPDSRIELPEWMTIPSGQSSTYFYVKVKANGKFDAKSSPSYISLTGSDYNKVSAILNIEDDTYPDLKISAVEQDVTEGGTITLTVSTDYAPAEDTEIRLSSDFSKRFDIPDALLHAGEKSVDIVVEAIDDNVPDINQAVTFTAFAAGYNSASMMTVLIDNDVPSLSMTLSPNAVSEAAGPLAVTAKIKRLDNIDKKITIKLSDDSDGSIYYGRQTFEMEAGVSEATLNLGPIDNSLVDGERTYKISAAVWIASCSCNASSGTSGGVVSVPLTVYDNDGPTLTLRTNKSILTEGGELVVTVTRNTATTNVLNVSLSSDHDDAIEYPETVTIPSGEATVSFIVKSKDNDVTGDGFNAMITASAEGFAKGTAWFTVSDQTLPDAQITSIEVSSDEVEVNEKVEISVVVSNTGNYLLQESTPISFYISSSSSAIGTAYLQSALGIGETTSIKSNVTMPSKIGTFNIHAVVNDLHSVNELCYTNNSSNIISVKTISPFSIMVNADKEIYNKGEKISISGVASGSDVSGKEIEIYVINSNYRHVIKAVTEQDGSFSVDYTPYEGQMGYFIFGACYPGENLRDEMGAFSVYGIKREQTSAITCEALLGEIYSGSMTLSNPGILGLSGLRASVVSKPDDCEVSVKCPTNVGAGEDFRLDFDITPIAASVSTEWEQIKLKVESNEGASTEATIYYYCRVKTGKLQSSVTRINTTMIKDQSRDYIFDITNVGKGETGKITLALPSWMSSATPTEMSSLAAGESATVILRLTPTTDMQLNVPVTGQIGINCANGEGLPLPFSIEPVSESMGILIIDVCDENTYYTMEKPHVAGASVTVSHPTTGVIVTSGTTDDNGKFQAVLPEGYYTVSVSAPSHNSYRNNLLVDPGVENLTTVNLSIEAITVDWKVEETTVQDEYSIITTVKYETNVPVPVVELSIPSSIDAKTLSEGESLIFYATLTNKGLITAEDVQLELPTGFRALEFEALSSYNESFSIAPQQSILVPIKVTHKQVSMAKTRAGAKPIDDDPCIGQVGTLYYWDCGNDRKWHRYGVALQLGSCRSDDPTTWDNSGNGTYGSTYGGGYGWGPGFGPGGGGGYYGSSSGSSNVSTNQDEGCEPCQNRLFYVMAKCAVNHVPIISDVWDIIGWITDPVGSAKDKAIDAIHDFIGEKIPIYGWVRKIIGYREIYEDCLKPLLQPCDREGANTNSTKARSNSKNLSGYPSYVTEYQNTLSYLLLASDARINKFTELFGDEKWINADPDELNAFMLAFNDYIELTITEDELKSYKPEGVSNDMFHRFVTRWYNTINEVESDNKIDLNKISEYNKTMNEVLEFVADKGFEKISDYYKVIEEEFISKLNDSQSSVCASISLQFSQKMVMTRQAFRGTLTVFNGNEDTPMTDVRLTLTVKDESGNVATSHEFQINPETLTGFEGDLNLTDGWTLDAQQTGVVTIMFIPTKYAAPTVERQYSFGGTLSYVDPFTGLTVTRDLFPVTLTVKPSPNLDLTYFMQRDIKGDDPLTEEIEPCEEAEFSLLINNIGYGDAQDVKMFTEQPKIVDNEKGLMIDFELMSSQLNGGEKTLALGGSVATDFGTIPAKSTSYAQWWIKSSLLGHFTEYNVEATHVTSYGNPDLSLLNDVTIHELIRSIDVENGNSKLVGFMTNDVVDAEDTPDMLYLSDGEIENVYVAQNMEMQKISSTDYSLKISANQMGWNYGSIADPTYGISSLKSVVRQSDGKAMPLRNFWQTDCTLRDGKDPLYENRLHFVDNILASDETYILTFEPTPTLLLGVASVDGVPKEGSLSTEPIEKVKVVFNKYIDPSTFTTDDISLAVQGVKQDVGSVGISTEDNKSFTLDFSLLNESVGNGYFVLTVNTSDIMDSEGFSGKNGKQVGWIMFRDGLVALTTATYPASAGIVQKLPVQSNVKALNGTQEADDCAEYGSTVRLTTTSNDGYEFSNWTINGEEVSTDPILEYVALGDMDVKANYALKTYSVTINKPNEGGVIDGGATGIYSHGEVLNFTASADEDFAFDHWTINGQDCGSDESLSIVIDGAKEVTANFRRVVFPQSLTLSKGWNWVSSYVSESVPLGNFYGSVTRIVSQFDEVIYDPVYGMTGNIEALRPGNAYKMDASYSSLKSFKGHLHDLSASPIVLHKGWNWISYPYIEEKSINAVIRNVSEGDVLTSQSGFSEYYDGCWEGTLNTLTPGVGYIYKSASEKTLEFDFSNDETKARVSSSNNADDSYCGNVDIHKYPSTMNIIARISAESFDIDEGRCVIYAFAGNECRGESQYVGGNHYLTVYGDVSTNITFIVENIDNGNTYMTNENVTFSQEIIGSRKEPYVITISKATDINGVSNSSHKMKIYTIEGILVDSDATADSLKKLNRGVYIVDGQKLMIR